MRKSTKRKHESSQVVDLNSKLKKLESITLDPSVLSWMMRGGARGVRERLLKIDFSVNQAAHKSNLVVNKQVKTGNIQTGLLRRKLAWARTANDYSVRKYDQVVGSACPLCVGV